jgi:hypothetical protein
MVHCDGTCKQLQPIESSQHTIVFFRCVIASAHPCIFLIAPRTALWETMEISIRCRQKEEYHV